MARILVCDDHAPLRELYQASLARQGHEVHVACDGVEGFNAFLDLDPALLITDWHMPGMNGLDLVLALRRLGREAPVILMSGGSTYIHGYLDNMVLLRKPVDLGMLDGLADALLRPGGRAPPGGGGGHSPSRTISR